MTEPLPPRPGPCRLVLLALVLAVGVLTHASPSDEALERLMEDFWEAQVRAAPLAASLWGENRYRIRSTTSAREALAAQVARLDRAIAALGEIDPENLSAANREHYEAFEWMLTTNGTTWISAPASSPSPPSAAGTAVLPT